MDKFSDIVKTVLKEGAMADGIENDSWWYEERPKTTSVADSSLMDVDYSQHDNLAPTQDNSSNQQQSPFNAYEQCNKLILCCNSRLDLVQHFCNIIADLTSDNEQAQQKLLTKFNDLYSRQLSDDSAQ